ncbi:MAG TPA: OadG family transporter subunit [Pseudomonas sp.]|nr:OadG family transporter subunit [Pseudomonas sp.]
MTPSQLLLEGVELMLFGMGSVFLFLALLILAIRLIARLIERFAPPAPMPSAAAPLPVKSGGHGLEPDVLTAIQTVIHQHRARRG